MGRPYRRVILPGVLAFAGLGACTGSDPVFVGAPVNTPDAGLDGDTAVDAAVVAPGDAAPAFESKNLLKGGDFEGAGCAQWSNTSASLMLSPLARGGAASCLACYKQAATNPENTYGVSQGISVKDLVDGATYNVRVWVRPADGRLPATDLHLELTLIDLDGQAIPGRPYTVVKFGALPDAKDWFPIEVDYPYSVAQNAALLAVAVVNRTGEETCFLVDDASFARKQ